MGCSRNCNRKCATLLQSRLPPRNISSVIVFIVLVHGITPRLGVWLMNVEYIAVPDEALLTDAYRP